MAAQEFGHALVLGGSLAGLFAARVLAERFARVTVLERDALDATGPRKGVPQAHHAHGLLGSGARALCAWFPGIRDEVVRAGGSSGDVGLGVRALSAAGERLAAPVGVDTFRLSRPALEDLVRARVRALPNLSLIGGADVHDCLYDRSTRRFLGAAWAGRDGAFQNAEADLVIDARGRGSRVVEWLRAHGEPQPAEERIEIGLGYVTRLFRVAPGARGMIVTVGGARGTRLGAAFPLEGGTLMATLGGYCGDSSPRELAGFLAFARTLASPEYAAAIEGLEPLGDARVFQTSASTRRHFEREAAPPAGLIVLGDAMCAFNPAFGQGMSSAALQAEALAATLADPAAARSGSEFARRYYARASRAADLPWQLALGEDLRVPGVRGVRPAGFALRRRFAERLTTAATRDLEVAAALTRVAHLLAPMSSLFAPRMLARILAASRKSRGAPSTPKA